jgi:hypothetical protein
MRAQILLLSLLVLSVSRLIGASPDRSWTYQEMLQKADLVVMAEWVSTKDTDERTTLPDTRPPVKVFGVTTEFEVSVVFKGGKDVQKLGLHHYRFQYEDEALRPFAPQLIRILEPVRRDGVDYPGGGKFLLFLVREKDGRYAPVTGQTDPALFSVLNLRAAVD